MLPHFDHHQAGEQDLGRVMVEGEHASISELSKYNPSLTPIPYAKGQFRDATTPTWFFLMEYMPINTGAPAPLPFCKQLADLHAKSVSPTGKFGFPVTTSAGPHPQPTTYWDDSWANFFSRLLRSFFEREEGLSGRSKDGAYETEFEKLLTVTIPVLLGAMQREGRTLKPSLVHGDLWEENCGEDLRTGQPKIYDPACFYGHNEYDLGMWRRPEIKFGRAHIRQYLRHMPPSEPTEQWDDRNRLYFLKFELNHMCGYQETSETKRSE